MRTTLTLAALVLAAGIAPAAAQSTAPTSGAGRAPSSAARAPMDAALPLNMAYHAIGRAEQAGATGRFIDAARAHYRGALDRYGRNDAAGAAAEARLAADLARAASDERPRATPAGPHDVPAPPSPRPRADAGGTALGDPGMMGGPDMMHGLMMHGMMMHGMMHARGFGHRGFSATHLAEALKVENGAEARQLAQAAVDANAAADRAALAGNRAEAERASRVAGDVMAAVDDLVRLNHPAPAPRAMRRPLAEAGSPG